jgi:hypothetical protein
MRYSSRQLQCLTPLLKCLQAALQGVHQQQVVPGGVVEVGMPGVVEQLLLAVVLLVARWRSPASWMAMSLSFRSS